MGRSEESVPDGPLKDFAEGLRSLRQRERLTYRQLSQRARYSYSVLSTAASGKVLPTLEVTVAYVGACHGDVAEWEERWERLAAVLRAGDAGLLPPEALGSAAAGTPPASCAPAFDTAEEAPSIERVDRDSPRRIGAFRILGRLGAGATSEVYLATGPSGRPAAVKLIRPQFAQDPQFCRLFARELAAARKINGDYTAAVIDADAHAEQPWIAYEFLAGPSLAQVIENQGPLPPAAVRTLAAGICEALRAFHAAGFVHRDLKPANVLLTDQGPRVIDFGIARCTDGTASAVTGTQLGTMGFMAPEQVDGGDVSAAADIFALGCVLAYAATGRAPFGNGSSASMLYRVVHGEPDEQAVACDDSQMRELIKRCLAKDPGQRPTPEQIIGDCAAAAETAGGGWLPSAVVAQTARLDAEAAALIKRAARRRALQRALTVSASLFAVLAIIVATVMPDTGVRRDLGGRLPTAPDGSGAPGLRSGTAPGSQGNRGLLPADKLFTAAPTGGAQPAAGATGSPPVDANTASAGSDPRAALSVRAFYSFEQSTDGWQAVGGAIAVVPSSAFHYDRLYSLSLSETSASATSLGDVAVTGLLNGPTVDSTVVAWIYVPLNVPQPVSAGLYVKDTAGSEHDAAAVTVRPGSWQQLTYSPAGYRGAAQTVGLKFTECGIVGAAVFIDAISWD